MSRHISRAWQGSSPPLGTRAAQLSTVSATVVEAVDRSRDRQTCVPSKIQEGRASLFFKEVHYRSGARPPLAVVWGGVVSCLSRGPSWNCHSRTIETIFLRCTHTHVCPPMHKTDTHTHTAILYQSRANLLKENSFVYIILDYVSFGRKTADWARCRAKVKVMRYPNKWFD